METRKGDGKTKAPCNPALGATIPVTNRISQLQVSEREREREKKRKKKKKEKKKKTFPVGIIKLGVSASTEAYGDPPR